MRPETAKRHLRKMLHTYTPGSVLMLLGEVFGEMADESREGVSDVMADNYLSAEATMTVVGLGLDAVLPKPEVR